MICVLGDVMLDKYTYGTVDRINPEAPVPILNVSYEKNTLGGAGNVAKNISSLNEKICLFGICGHDQFGNKIKELCNENNINYYLIDDGRPTIIKHRFVALGYNQQLLRVDYEKKHPIHNEYIPHIIKKLIEMDPKIIVISDYAKGFITKKLMDNLKKNCSGKILVDPKPSNANFYKNVYLVKPNLKETSEILNKNVKNNDEEVEKAGLKLVEIFNSNIVITRSHKGSTLITQEGDIYHIPTMAKEVHDVSGAGDTYIAVLSYALNNNYPLKEAVELANKGSSIVVGKLGTASITIEELFGR